MSSAVLFLTALLLPPEAAAGPQAIVDAQRPGNGVSMPTIVTEIRPSYSPEALMVGVEGAVHLECVVNPEGTVRDIRVVKPLYPPLDQAAVKSLEQWRFKPGMRDGKAVPVLIDVEMSFSMGRSEPALDSSKVFKPGDGTMAPRVLSEVKPVYTEGAKQAGIQGTVVFEFVVRPDGTVGDIRLKQSLEPGLDVEAVKALRKWRFAPGQRDGVAVPVQVSAELTFMLK